MSHLLNSTHSNQHKNPYIHIKNHNHTKYSTHIIKTINKNTSFIKIKDHISRSTNTHHLHRQNQHYPQHKNRHKKTKRRWNISSWKHNTKKLEYETKLNSSPTNTKPEPESKNTQQNRSKRKIIPKSLWKQSNVQTILMCVDKQEYRKSSLLPFLDFHISFFHNFNWFI